MNKYIEGLCRTFVENRKLTYTLVEHLSEEQLVTSFKRPGIDNVSKQVQEMADVQIAFVKAITSGTIDFSTVPSVFDYKSISNKEQLIQHLSSADQFMEKVFKDEKLKESVEWDGEQIDICSHLSSLIGHEIFHQGQIAMALYWMDIEIPETWCHMWGMPSNCKHN